MANYGTNVSLAPSVGKRMLADVDFNKIGMICNCERGIDQIMTEIYSMSDFEEKCGEAASGKYGWYIARSFYDGLESGVNVESTVLGYVASDAVQASGEIADSATVPEKIFDIKAGYEGVADKSAFGNRIGYKIENSENISYELSEDTSATPTSAVLVSTEHLKVGYFVKFTEGSDIEVAKIVTLDEATKTITFAALTNTYTAVGCAITRIDWTLIVGLKDVNGVYQEKEKWQELPFYMTDDTEGLQKDTNAGSKYIILAANSSNSSDAEDQCPDEVTTWTALTAGSDGTAAVDADWNTLLPSLDDSDFSILFAPESASSTHNVNMSVKATALKKYIYYIQAANEASDSSLKSLASNIRRTKAFSMLPMDKWLATIDPLTGNLKDIPPIGYAAAHYFNSYNRYGVKRVAAGNMNALLTSDVLDETNELIHDDVAGKGANLIRNYGVNLSRFKKGKGILINSARTMSTDPGYQYQNQIMGWLLIRKSVIAYLKTVEQNPSGVDAQGQHRNAIWAYLLKKYNAGVFYKGQRVDGTPTDMADVVIVVNDFSINSLVDIAAGKESIFVQCVFVPPIEEIWLNLASAAVTSI